MQNCYVGDIGDYMKFGILRALSPGYRLGVIWWLHPDETHKSDGQHLSYLDQPSRWRHYDPGLFDHLAHLVMSGQRHVQALEAAGILPGSVFASDVIPAIGAISNRQQARLRWFASVAQQMHGADLVFVDPDNGLEPDSFTHGSAKAGKSVTLAELRSLSKPERCLIVYHHQTRRSGGHHAEIGYWADRLRNCGIATRVDALRAKPYSPRAFFLLDASDDLRRRARMVAEQWKGLIDWYSDPVEAGTVASAKRSKPASGSTPSVNTLGLSSLGHPG
jgi:hypothetical protein